jgi:hypothetical protein
MSRRHHGGRPHRANGPGRPIDTSRPIAPAASPEHQPAATTAAQPGQPAEPATDVATAPTAIPEELIRAATATPLTNGASARPAPAISPATPPDREGGEPLSRIDGVSEPVTAGNGAAAVPALERQPGVNGSRPLNGPPLGAGGACTAPQLRRFIKSRPYVPMHELRRRFGIDGGEDDVTSVDLASGRIYVGLPSREGYLLGELLRGGEVGFELSLDPRSPVVVGLYPMRPVART